MSSAKSKQQRHLAHHSSYRAHHDAQPRRASIDVSNVVNYLRPQKIDIDSILEQSGLTVLISACESNSTAEVKQLLDQGANVNAADSSGRSPLMVACAEGNMEILTILLEHRTVVLKLSLIHI